MPQGSSYRSLLHSLILLLALCVFARAASIEPAIVPTVHTTLTPASAIQAPLRFYADQTSVWSASQEQRMLLTGRVSVAVGYRLLNADAAAVWLTPSRESGESVYDVAIYLSGNVSVREGNLKNSTTTVGTELLVTTRVTETVQLSSNPVSKSEEDSPIVKRGMQIRDEVLHRELTPLHVPVIVITDAEQALQSGWIARGPNNRIVPGPGDLQIVRDAHGNIIPGGSLTQVKRPAKPRPSAFVTGDNPHTVQVGNELVTIVPGAYLLYDSLDGKPPLEFRAQRMVLFSPDPDAANKAAAAGTQPSTAPATQAATKPAAADDISRYVTGAYLEGDVTLDQGNQIMIRAERVYYDFTTQRAVMLDATLATIDEKRDVPVYMRAGEIRQLARGEFAAKKVMFSTSEFYTPHYHIGASEVYLRDVTPELSSPNGGAAPGMELGIGAGNIEDKTFQFQVKDATINILGKPVFYWPFLAGDTGQNEIPLRTIRVSNSRTYGPSILTDWDLFSLAGKTAPEGVRADLNLDYFGKRGPAAGVQSEWQTEDDHGIARTYALLDDGTDRLGKDRSDVIPTDKARGRATIRDQHDLGDGLTLQLEASYISDPTFLEQFFQREFDSDKEHETSFYLKKQNETDALTFLGKFNLMDFTATADSVDSQAFTEKKPEIKYWRIGDNFFDLLTYYSETGLANVHSNLTNFTPNQLGLLPTFLGPPANIIPQKFPPGTLDVNGKDANLEAYLSSRYRTIFENAGWTSGDVLRADTRHEVDMPLQLGDVKVSPYVTGRATFWDQDFPETPVAGGATSGSTARYWAGAGIRASTQLWRVYDDVESTFFDVHRLRHVIEPQFNLFVGADNVDRSQLQPFDRDVEGITGASGSQVAINQKWQTKRGGPGHWRDVDWITLNVSWNQFWNKDSLNSKNPTFFPTPPARGFFFSSRPELSLVQNSINVDGTWRVGERMRLIGDADYSLDGHKIEQASGGIAVDQTKNLSYFLGGRYVTNIPSYVISPITQIPTPVFLTSDQWTVAMDYQLTQKYEMITAESYDFSAGSNILTSFTVIRKLPRFNVAVTVTYDANNADTSVSVTAWPEGLANMGFGNQTGSSIDRR